MSAEALIMEMQLERPVPRLLVELPPRHRVFFSNLRDLLLPRRLPPLELLSSPAPFWPDVFVKRTFPWYSFLESGAYHVIAVTVLIGFTHVLGLRPRVETKPRFDHSQVIYYQPSEYLPPLDTLRASNELPRKADPELSRQPIISVPREADNRSQTIVTPPQVKLKSDVAVPNIVAWSDNVQKPRLAIPDAPVSPAAEITRLAPELQSSVAAPPQDAARTAQRRNSPSLQDPVAPPPSDVRPGAPTVAQGLQPALVAPPSDVQSSSSRTLGDMNIAPSAVIAPAPQLPVAAQRSIPGGGGPALGAPVAPPPSSLPASGAAGSPGRMIALSLHPAVNAPPDPPAGNRRGTFAAGPEGHAGATGTPGSASGSAMSGSASTGTHGAGTNGGTASKATGEAPAGLYVGKAANPAPVTADPAAKTVSPSVNPNLIASVRPPRVTSARPMEPDSAAKLSDAERAVFGNRRFYSVTLNMPNLNSAGGSWIIRFAEFKHDSSPRDANAPAADLSQPMATRKVDPAYPIQLMRENVHGTVIVYAVIRADGSVGSVRVLRGADERLDRFATEAVSQWKFEPATRNGMPVDVEATFQIPFRPARTGANF
ncbi:MAG TPA: TonB family protein [Candidatus Sulfotelmatobacter sp.]|nr:TonB family protein [Candidatus Sulfotelmatobacter sp.]